MTLEDCFKTRSEINAEIHNLENRLAQLKVGKEKVLEEYVETNRKFKNGDIVRYADSPKGKHFIVTDAYGVAYCETYPLSISDTPNPFGIGTSFVNIRYHVETKNGWKPNSGWAICEDKLVLIEKD